MHSELHVDQGLDRAARYATLLPQVKALLDGETNTVANMANLSAAVFATFGFHWVGFYLVDGETLVLGPFQGPIACTRLFRGKGVCAAAWESGKTLIVDDVDAFPGHVACSSLSRSEIVVPVKNAAGEVVAVFDVDSTELADFSDVDRTGLEALVAVLEDQL